MNTTFFILFVIFLLSIAVTIFGNINRKQRVPKKVSFDLTQQIIPTKIVPEEKKDVMFYPTTLKYFPDQEVLQNVYPRDTNWDHNEWVSFPENPLTAETPDMPINSAILKDQP